MNAGTSAAWQLLDSDWFYLGRAMGDRFAALQLVSQDRVAVPLFSDGERAQALLAAAPEGTSLHEVAAGDMRAKEEWLRAAIEAGATRLLADPDPRTGEPAGALPLDLALDYILSFRRETACL